MGRCLVLSSGGPETADLLVIAGTHPFPPRKAGALRVAQYVRWLSERGLVIDLAVLSDAASADRDFEAARAALRHVRKVLVVPVPVRSRLVRLAARALGRPLGPRPAPSACPGRFVRAARRCFARVRHRSVVVAGAGLSRAAAAFRPEGRKVLDAQSIGYDRYRSLAALGRGAEMAAYADPRREARLASAFDAVLTTSERDAGLLLRIGVRAPIVVVPFAAPEVPDPGSTGGEPSRPLRILFVSSGSPDQLDGFRFFRARVLPAICRQAPAARLKVIGLASHLLDPGPGVELAGSSDRLDEEYRQAAAVVVPVRTEGGLRVQAVEALAHGKALIATSAGVEGIDLVPGRDAVVSDDPAVLGREAVRVLTDDSFRRSLEASARTLARRLFDPDRVFRPLLDLLGAERRPPLLAPGVPGRLKSKGRHRETAPS